MNVQILNIGLFLHTLCYLHNCNTSNVRDFFWHYGSKTIIQLYCEASVTLSVTEEECSKICIKRQHFKKVIVLNSITWLERFKQEKIHKFKAHMIPEENSKRKPKSLTKKINFASKPSNWLQSTIFVRRNKITFMKLRIYLCCLPFQNYLLTVFHSHQNCNILQTAQTLELKQPLWNRIWFQENQD